MYTILRFVASFVSMVWTGSRLCTRYAKKRLEQHIARSLSFAYAGAEPHAYACACACAYADARMHAWIAMDV